MKTRIYKIKKLTKEEIVDENRYLITHNKIKGIYTFGKTIEEAQINFQMVLLDYIYIMFDHGVEVLEKQFDDLYCTTKKQRLERKITRAKYKKGDNKND